MRQTFGRAGLGALVILMAGALSSCDSRGGPAGSGGGGNMVLPTVVINVANAQNDEVNVESSIVAEIRSTHTLSLLAVFDTVSVDGVVIRTDSTRFTSTTTNHVRQVPIPAAGLRSGQQIRIVAYAVDGQRNMAVAQRVLTVYDTTSPRVVVQQPTVNKVLRPGTLVDSVQVFASDSTGLATIGYRFYADSILTASSVPVGGDSIAVVPQATVATRKLPVQVPPTMPPGRYFIRGFADDISGLRGYSSLVGIFVQDTIKPTVAITVMNLQFQPRDTILIGDSVIVEHVLHDNLGLNGLSVRGVALVGDPALGPVDTIAIYQTATFSVPAGVTLTDTVVRRLLVPVTNAPTQYSTIHFIAVVTDRAGNSAVASRPVYRVSGPKVDVIRPTNNEERARGEELTIELFATDPQGVRVLGFTLTGSGFPDLSRDTTLTTKQDTLRYLFRFTVPEEAVIGSTITITPSARDMDNQVGIGPSRFVTVVAVGTDTVPPFVYQTVPPRSELGDSIAVRATDRSRITRIGYEMRSRRTGDLIVTAERALPSPWPSDTTVRFRFDDEAAYVQNLIRYRGEPVILMSFADDSLGNRGYTVASTNLTTPEGNPALARRDTVLLVFGYTHVLPAGGSGADIAVDPATHDVFVSNLTFNQLDIWRNTLRGFDGSLVLVGAGPWGMAIDTSGGQLLVANSGGTNISVVSLSTRAEVRRINTPNMITWDVAYSQDQSTGFLRYTLSAPIQYSDRPQFIAQSENGNIYYSTRPTSSARPGTVRRLDPEPIAWGTTTRVDTVAIRQIWQYGAHRNGHYVVLNADWVSVVKALSTSFPDTITICDHPFGRSTAAMICETDITVGPIVSRLRSQGADVEVAIDLDVESLSLTDTTFVASGGDLRWLAFGEGATQRPGRVILVKDTLGTDPFQATYSSGIEVADLTNNASDRIFGVALNTNSSMLGVHGMGAFFGDTALRLQGTVQMGGGAGIAFHPQNDGNPSPPDPVSRTALVAEGDTTIAILDTYFFRRRGTLPLRHNITGAIRAVVPTAAELTVDPQLALKLFALTPTGMIVINVRRCDIDNDSAFCP
ncbi:MAG TPA: hypothetical protein VMM18_03320 [Gemmatimonadaceae bacterium]|nr:hypothetical protein [Gemmatimonadaceae bacterium]